MANYCKNCGAALAPNDFYCPKCGAVQNVVGAGSNPFETPSYSGANDYSYDGGDAPEIPTNPIAALRICLMEKYAKFSGRASRSEFWQWQLVMWLITFPLGFIFSAADAKGNDGLSVGCALALVAISLITLIPSWAVAVRRLHDRDKSGWLILIGIIPYIGAIYLFIQDVLAGTPGPNRFGPAPRRK